MYLEEAAPCAARAPASSATPGTPVAGTVGVGRSAVDDLDDRSAFTGAFGMACNGRGSGRNGGNRQRGHC